MADLWTLRITRRISPYSEILTLIHRISTDYKENIHQILYLATLNFVYLAKLYLFSEFLDYSIQTSNFNHPFYIYLSELYIYSQNFWIIWLKFQSFTFKFYSVYLIITFLVNISFIFKLKFISILLSIKHLLRYFNQQFS